MSPRDWPCPTCRALNDPSTDACEQCGTARPSSRTTSHTCPFDGARLHANGFCPTGNGYPITLAQCPDACPYCRRPLRWDGDCNHCQPPLEKPGHLYDDDGTGHWRLTLRGPQKIVPPSPEQRATLAALFARFPTTR